MAGAKQAPFHPALWKTVNAFNDIQGGAATRCVRAADFAGPHAL